MSHCEAQNDVTYARLQLPPLNVGSLAQAVLTKSSELGRSGYIDFDGDRWAGWRINGCGQKARGDLILGYYMNPELTYMHYFPEAEELISIIPGIKYAVRLFKLSAGASVGLHRDEGEHYLERKWWEVRKVHIPLVTNEGCRHLYADAEGQLKSIKMQLGEAWYLNGTGLHGAENLGDADRWHLVIDVEPTPSLYSLIALNV